MFLVAGLKIVYLAQLNTIKLFVAGSLFDLCLSYFSFYGVRKKRVDMVLLFLKLLLTAALRNEILLRTDSLSKKGFGFEKIRKLSAYFYGLDFRGSIGNGSLPIMHCADKCQLSIRQENKKLSGIRIPSSM